MKTLSLCLVISLILLGSTVALGDPVQSIRCGTHVIEIGDSVATVFQNCGKPTHKDGNVWFYDMGPGESIKVFHMENEQVDSMEEVERE